MAGRKKHLVEIDYVIKLPALKYEHCEPFNQLEKVKNKAKELMTEFKTDHSEIHWETDKAKFKIDIDAKAY